MNAMQHVLTSRRITPRISANSENKFGKKRREKPLPITYSNDYFHIYYFYPLHFIMIEDDNFLCHFDDFAVQSSEALQSKSIEGVRLHFSDI